MICELLKFKDLGEAELARWDELRDCHDAYRSPFFSPTFTRIVSEVRDNVRVIVFGEGDDIDMIWPIQVNGRNAEPAGAPFADYHGPLARAGWSGDLAVILNRLKLNTIRMTSAYDPNGHVRGFVNSTDIAYITDLRDGAAAFFEYQQNEYPRHAKKMRRLDRKISREIGDLTFNFDNQDESCWDQLMSLKRQQYRETGRHDVLGPEWSREMMRRLWHSDDPGCKGYMHSLTSNGTFLAAEFNLTCRSTLHGWIPVYQPEYSSYSPGSVIQHYIIEEADRRGFHFYDYGTSAGHYKKYYTNMEIEVVGGTVRSNSVGAKAGAVVESLWHGIENAGIPKLSGLAGQVRRRYEIIRTAETSMAGRLRGIASAATQVSKI